MASDVRRRLDPLERRDRSAGNYAEAVRLQLRTLILDGDIRPGAVLSQVELARDLGISRGPLREALRMLLEEGLVEAEPNRRVRVAGFDAADLDSIYACRIALEATAIHITVRLLDDAYFEAVEACLDRLRELAEEADVTRREETHRRFHLLLVGLAPAPMLRTIEAHLDRGARYRRLYELGESRAWTIANREHAEIVDACAARDGSLAAARLARHLSRTAFSLSRELAPGYPLIAVRAAAEIAGAELDASWQSDGASGLATGV